MNTPDNPFASRTSCCADPTAEELKDFSPVDDRDTAQPGDWLQFADDYLRGCPGSWVDTSAGRTVAEIKSRNPGIVVAVLRYRPKPVSPRWNPFADRRGYGNPPTTEELKDFVQLAPDDIRQPGDWVPYDKDAAARWGRGNPGIWVDSTIGDKVSIETILRYRPDPRVTELQEKLKGAEGELARTRGQIRDCLSLQSQLDNSHHELTNARVALDNAKRDARHTQIQLDDARNELERTRKAFADQSTTMAKMTAALAPYATVDRMDSWASVLAGVIGRLKKAEATPTPAPAPKAETPKKRFMSAMDASRHEGRRAMIAAELSAALVGYETGGLRSPHSLAKMTIERTDAIMAALKSTAAQ